MSDWKKTWSDAWPDWKDGGRSIEIRYEDGRIVSGTLSIEDMTPGPDEAPIFYVRTADGSLVSFADCEEWRYV